MVVLLSPPPIPSPDFVVVVVHWMDGLPPLQSFDCPPPLVQVCPVTTVLAKLLPVIVGATATATITLMIAIANAVFVSIINYSISVL